MKNLVMVERINEYRELISENSLYNGLELVLDSQVLIDKVEELVEELMEDMDDEDKIEFYDGYVVDSVDVIIMEEFVNQLVLNMLSEGFVWDGTECWSIPSKYVNEKNSELDLTCYGIVWDILPMDFDTSVRERVSDRMLDGINL